MTRKKYRHCAAQYEHYYFGEWGNVIAHVCLFVYLWTELRETFSTDSHEVL